MRWPSAAGTTVWQGRALQRATGERLWGTGCGWKDEAGGVKCVGRFLRGRCGAGAVVAGAGGRIKKPPDPMWAGGLSLLVTLEAKLVASGYL